MKLLLIAVNAKYIHSNLAVYSLQKYAQKQGVATTVKEYTINYTLDAILRDIYEEKPDMAAFSCYIWNRQYVVSLITDLHKVLPKTEIWVGGPEVSYDAEQFLREFPQVRGVMAGEGEKTFAEVANIYLLEAGRRQFDGCRGTIWRDEKGKIHREADRELMALDEIPFVYEDLSAFDNRILYYESSRGCPFSCSYCLSSLDKRVRLRSLDAVRDELQFFLDRKVMQVKFVDRTFNCSRTHAMAIWEYIKENDNGVTNFHFEIGADLLGEEELLLLNSLRSGLIQLEIGVQSTNPRTLREIERTADFRKIQENVRRIAAEGNIHQHLDLIAGLPFEDFESFVNSFNDVYRLRPHQLQLGFLKVLKGSKMYCDAEQYGIVYRNDPPYEALFTRWLSYEQTLCLKGVEEMVEVYYNSAQFSNTMRRLEEEFIHPFAMYEALMEYYRKEGLFEKKHSRMDRLNILRCFIQELTDADRNRYDALLLMDLYLRENSKSRPSWAPDLTPVRGEIQEFYQEEEKKRNYLGGYVGYNWKQLMHMTHMEALPDGSWYLFDYRKRNPLTKDAAVYRIR